MTRAAQGPTNIRIRGCVEGKKREKAAHQAAPEAGQHSLYHTTPTFDICDDTRRPDLEGCSITRWYKLGQLAALSGRQGAAHLPEP